MLLAVGALAALGAADLSISTLDLSRCTQGFGEPGVDKSVEGHPLTIAGTTYAHGLGAHAEMQLPIDLKKTATRFTASVGVDDETAGKGTVEFRVICDGKRVWNSGVMHGHEVAKTIDVPLTGVAKLLLVVSDGGDGIAYDHADWAEAVISYDGTAPVALIVNEPKVVLTPKSSPKPRINGAKVVGVRPGSPFLSIIAATGERPMRFAATGLPAGLSLDAVTGIITGTLGERGEHDVTVTAANALGTATRHLRIVVSDRLALTPPMGWNSWNCFASAVTAENLYAAADSFVSSGLRDHGWTYVNIDDFWMPKNGDADATLHGPERDADGRINANPRFPDMKKLTDHIHSLGLKAGIYSSPGPTTCGGCVSSYRHERQDAERLNAWGFDYLKYDWCSYGEVEKGEGLPYFKKPYVLMGDMLRAQPRDILFSLCQYGMGNVWTWGDEVHGNCWRTTGDINDSWGSMSGIGFSQAGHELYAGPGHWNDPDMLVVGWVGWGPSLHPTHLTGNEQYTHISLWSLLCAPLLIGCDLTKLDEFTLNLLTNDEVIEVSQDAAGFQARRISKGGDAEVWAKTLEDGSKAVGLFNLGDEEQQVRVSWHSLELQGPQLVRDLWRQADLGTSADGFEASVARHGCMLIKVSPPNVR
jgi:alpha-galactosidase